MATQWMKCKVHKSTFSNERVIELKDRDFVVPADKVKGEPGGSGQVEVKVFSRPDGIWVEVPSANSKVIPIDDPDLLIQENNMNRLFYINEEERGIEKSYALAKFCVIKMLCDLGSSNPIVVLAPSFRQSKIVLNYVHEFLNDLKIFHEFIQEVDRVTICFADCNNIFCVPINEQEGMLATCAVLDEFRMIPHEIVSELEQNYGPLTDIRKHNFFEFKGQKHACI